MRILIYKRTHDGDPDIQGKFGNEGCMGRIRGYNFDAVIGVGGRGSWSISQGIARKVNWVGRHPIKTPNPVDQRGPLLTFCENDFRIFEQDGPALDAVAPHIADWVEHSRARFCITVESNRECMFDEARSLIARILDKHEFDHLRLTTRSPSDTCGNHGPCAGKNAN